MWNRVRKWLGKGPGSGDSQSGAGDRRRKTGPGEWLFIDLDKEFYGLMLGVYSFTEDPLNDLEHRVLDQTQGIISSGKLSDRLPRLPEAVPLLMKALKDENAANQELAEYIQRDGTLAGEVVRLSNSPFYYRGHIIKSLEQAVFLLGRDGLRALTARVAVRPVFDLEGGHFERLFGRRIWSQAERCAVACRCFTRSEPADPFEAYLAGLVHNIGFIIGAQVLSENLDQLDAPRSLVFRESFIPQCQWLSYLVAMEWGFPSSVLKALEEQTSGLEMEEMSTLGAILRWSVEMSQIITLQEEGRVEASPEQVVQWVGARSLSRCDRCYRELRSVLERQSSRG